MLKHHVFIVLIFLLLNIISIYSEETRKQPDPIELPAFIIEGVERLSVRTGIKQNPVLTSPMNKSELDSLNNLEKHPPQMLPLNALPENLPKRQYYNGYISAEFGKYTTGNIDAAYNFNINDYKISTSGNINFSNGHQINAEYLKTNFDLALEYIAPQKYWIFGGSRTITHLNFKLNDYSLYSIAEAPSREVLNISLNVDVDGNYESYRYELGGNLSTLKFTKSPNSLSENILGGYLQIKNFWHGILIGGDVSIDLQNIHNQAANFFQGNIFGSYQISDLTINLKTGLQGASNTNAIARGGFLIDFIAVFRINKSFTITGSASSGLEKRNLSYFHEINPYVTNFPNIDFPYNTLKLNAALTYHPLTNLGVTALIESNLQERTPYFTSNDSATFEIKYTKTQQSNLSLEAFWDISNNDKIIGNLSYQSIFSPDINEKYNLSNATITHIPKIKADLSYKRTWNDYFGTFIGITYIDSRFADEENKIKLAPYANVYGGAYLKLLKNLTLMGKFDNLLNSNIYIWSNYKERDMFFSLALMWNF